MRNGCLLGNFTAEASEHSEKLRNRLVEIFAEVTEAIADCLRAAVAAGELRADIDCDEVAAFIECPRYHGANLMGQGGAQPGSGGAVQAHPVFDGAAQSGLMAG